MAVKKTAITETIQAQREQFGQMVAQSMLRPSLSLTKHIGFAGFVAGTFDYLELEGLIDEHIAKEGSHVRVNSGALVTVTQKVDLRL